MPRSRLSHLLLVPNNRLKKWLITNPKALNSILGTESSYQIHTQKSWLHKSWQALEPNPDKVLYEPLQEYIAWEQALYSVHADSYPTQSLIEQLQILNQWCYEFLVPEEKLTDQAQTQDQKLFVAVRKQYKKQKKAISHYELFAYLLKQAAFVQDLPQRVSLLNFTAITPVFRALLKECSDKHAIDIEEINIGQSQPKAEIEQMPCVDDEDELSQVLDYAYQVTQEQDKAQIAVVIRNLHVVRGKVELLCMQKFGEQPEIYNVSLTSSLYDIPAVNCASKLLRYIVTKSELTSMELVDLLLQQHWLLNTSTLVDKLREQQPHNYSWIDLLAFLRLENTIDEDTEQRLLLKTENLEKNDFFNSICELLDSLGWRVSADIMQLYLQNLAIVDKQVVGMGLLSKITYLEWLLCKSFYTDRHSDKASIHIMGELESAPVPFTTIIITDAIAGRLRASAKYSQFISAQIQDNYSMPHTEKWQSEFFSNLFNQWHGNNQRVIFSHQCDHEMQEQPDALVKDAPLVVLQLKKHEDSIKDTSKTDVETLSQLNAGKLIGGASLLTSMHQCPLKAQAQYRLGLKQLPFVPQIKHKQLAGQYIHSVLEKFYGIIDDAQSLKMLTKDEIFARLQSCTKSLVQAIYKNNSTIIWAIADELLKQAANYIMYEQTRSNFQIVARELPIEIAIANCTFKLRLDRIDCVEAESKESPYLLIIDYKARASSGNIKSVMEASKDNLRNITQLPIQLMLYALTKPSHKAPIKSVAYAHINYNAVGQPLQQIFWRDEDDPKPKWQSYIAELTDEYLRGNCIALPHTSHCSYCDYANFCRQSAVS